MGELVSVSRAIHDDPELCFAEHHASAMLGQWLSRSGFAVEPGVCKLPTAFRAVAGTGELSVVLCAEYDALAGVGHACGHNVIAAAALGAGIGLAAVADEVGMTVTVLGTPAEEGGGGKVFLLDRGAFDGAHASLMVHPWHEDRLGAKCLAVDHLEVEFTGREAHASAAPHQGVNAADAAVVSQVAIGLLRQQLPPGDQVHCIVTHGGDAVNVIPRRTVLKCMVRSATLESLTQLRPRVERCFEAGAIASACDVSVRDLSPTYSDYVPDEGLLELWRANAEALGRRYRADDAGDPVPTVSTDMANVSRAMPALHPLVGIDAGGVGVHHPGFAEAAVGPSAEVALHDGAVAMAWTAIDAALNPSVRDRLLSRAFEAPGA
ncbi:MAG: M20 family metallopeptidase [Acidimicrobiales bacterium]